jgi:hypothetical protein
MNSEWDSKADLLEVMGIETEKNGCLMEDRRLGALNFVWVELCKKDVCNSIDVIYAKLAIVERYSKCIRNVISRSLDVRLKLPRL